jgi:hypothetical protein
MARWIKPTVDTKFHIDYDWWEQSGRNFRLYLLEQLCDECRQRFSSHRETETVDWVDPETGEVSEADALLQCLRRECASQPDYINERIPLAAAVFRIFLANNNTPLSCGELHERLPWKQPDLILRTLGGQQTYQGIRPE